MVWRRFKYRQNYYLGPFPNLLLVSIFIYKSIIYKSSFVERHFSFQQSSIFFLFKYTINWSFEFAGIILLMQITVCWNNILN